MPPMWPIQNSQQGTKNSFVKTSHKRLHSSWNWFDKYSTKPLAAKTKQPIWSKSKSDEGIFATQRQRWSRSTDKKRAKNRSILSKRKNIQRMLNLVECWRQERDCLQASAHTVCAHLTLFIKNSRRIEHLVEKGLVLAKECVHSSQSSLCGQLGQNTLFPSHCGISLKLSLPSLSHHCKTHFASLSFLMLFKTKAIPHSLRHTSWPWSAKSRCLLKSASGPVCLQRQEISPFKEKV